MNWQEAAAIIAAANPDIVAAVGSSPDRILFWAKWNIYAYGGHWPQLDDAMAQQRMIEHAEAIRGNPYWVAVDDARQRLARLDGNYARVTVQELVNKVLSDPTLFVGEDRLRATLRAGPSQTAVVPPQTPTGGGGTVTAPGGPTVPVTPAPGDFTGTTGSLNDIAEWVQANPLLAGGVAAVILFVLARRR